MNQSLEPRKFRVFQRKDIDDVPELQRLDPEQRIDMKAVSAVLPFRVNNYVVEDLIDWDDVPNDPIYQLTFPQREMLEASEFQVVRRLVADGAEESAIREAARAIQMRMNPHPAGQTQLNVPTVDGTALEGAQHKYRETVLFFPSQGQTCHAYCTYCFRWAQFVGLNELKFASREAERLVEYLRANPGVTDVLFTGGDPLVMKTTVLRRYVEALLDANLPNLRSIRIGSKAPAYWPYRFVTDRDADDLLRLFEQVVAKGKHLALMAHFSHPRELSTPIAQTALKRIIGTGAVVRCQAPLIRHVNDNADAWARMWQRQVDLGAVPYYMFVERDTGPKHYFSLPLARAFDIFNEAYRKVSGLARTVRGPSMSATPGKVLVDGVTEVNGEKVFVLKMLQGRNPEWPGTIFFAKYDPAAIWLDDLKPALGQHEFFFEEHLRDLARERAGTHRIPLPMAHAPSTQPSLSSEATPMSLEADALGAE